MEFIKIIILGITEGLTEFLPISSTAHLLVAERLLHFKDEASLFTVVIQVGAILAAAWYFKHDLAHIVKKLIAKDKVMVRFTRNIVIGLLPAGVIGYIVEKTVGIPDSLVLVAVSLILGGLVLWVVENHYNVKPLADGEIGYEEITGRRSLLIGLSQALAIVPGVSRSGATIVSGMLCGLDRKTATVFSFYLGIPIMLAATILKLKDGSSKISLITGGSIGLIIGVVSAFIAAFLVVNWLLKYVQKNNFKPFAYYRMLFGSLLLMLLALGKL
jgi:undecaprenyl-diphosphatase